jgi:hypothetical protein
VRHVVVVENSAAMGEQREQTADLLSRLFLDGFHGRAQLGDVIELWVVDENVETNALPAFRWHPIASIDNSTSTYRYLKALKSSTQTVSFRNAISLLDLENPKIPQLLVYIACSGFNLVEGTPYDDKINVIFSAHRNKLAKGGLPFITVLAAENGKWIGHGVTPGDRNPYIPPFPPPPAPPVAPKPAATVKTNTPAPLIGITPQPSNPKPRPLTVAEIQAQMKQADLARALTNRQPPAVQTPQATPLAQKTETNAPALTEAQTRVSTPTSNSTPQVATTDTPTSIPDPETNAPQVAVAAPPNAPAPESQSAPKTTNSQPTAANTHQLTPQSTTSSTWKYLSLGLLYLTAAGALVVVLLRQGKRHKHPSVITESLNQPPRTTRHNP